MPCPQCGPTPMSCFCPAVLGKVQGKPWPQRGWETDPKDGGRGCSGPDGDWNLVTGSTATECGAWCEGAGRLLLGMAQNLLRVVVANTERGSFRREIKR